MAIEIIGNGIISMMDTGLLFLFVGLFSIKKDLNKIVRILPFLMAAIIHFIFTIFHLEASTLKIPVYFLLDILFCFIRFNDKWFKYIINVGLFYVLNIIIEVFFTVIFNFFDIDNYNAFRSYDTLMFAIIVIMRFFTLLVILLIKSAMNREHTVRQKQWYVFLLMPVFTISFTWFIYRRYWGMGNPEIDKLLTYVGIFLVIQNVFVFFYIISLQSSTKQYIEIKEAFDRREEYFRTVKAIQTAVRKMAHDIRHHFIYLRSALEKEDIPKAKEYLIKLDENLENMVPLSITGHYDVDALLHSKSRLADKINIHLCVEGTLPSEIMVSPIDLSALLGNSIDNAIEAASMLDGRKEIFISFGYNASRLNFSITNPYDGEIQKKANGLLASRKLNGGLGIEIMDEVVKKYNGALSTEYSEDKFTLTAILQT